MARFLLFALFAVVASLPAYSADLDFSVATNLVIEAPDTDNDGQPGPLLAGEVTNLWTSPVIGQGATYNSVSLTANFEAVVPDTALVAPFHWRLALVLEQELSNGVWVEIGRQKTPFFKLSDGLERVIVVSPRLVIVDDNDQTVNSVDGQIHTYRSFFVGDSSGDIRVRLEAVDFNPQLVDTKTCPHNGPQCGQPTFFKSVTVSIGGQRFEG